MITAVGLLIGIRVLTEAVPPEIFGTVSLLLGLLSTAGHVFLTPQLHAAVRFYSELAHEGKVSRLRRTGLHLFGWTTIVLAGLLLIGGLLATLVWDVSFFVILTLPLLLMAEAARSFEIALLGAASRQRAYTIWTSTEILARPFLAVLAVQVVGPSAEAVLAGNLVATAGVYWLFKAAIPFEGRGAADSIQERDPHLEDQIRRYALPLMPLGLIAWVTALSDRYIIGGLLGLEAAGVYAAAYSLMFRPFSMAGMILELMLRPIYFNAVSSNNHALERRTLRIWIGGVALISVLGVLLIACFKDLITYCLLAPKYAAAASLMPWIALGQALLAISYVLEKPCYAYKRTGWVTVINTAGAVATVGVGIPLVSVFGLAGAAAGVPIYYGIQLCVALVAKWVVESNH